MVFQLCSVYSYLIISCKTVIKFLIYTDCGLTFPHLQMQNSFLQATCLYPHIRLNESRFENQARTTEVLPRVLTTIRCMSEKNLIFAVSFHGIILSNKNKLVLNLFGPFPILQKQ